MKKITSTIQLKLAKFITIIAFSSLFSFSVFAADADAGKTAYTNKGCAACHGADAISQIPTYPNLKGQKEAYIVDAIGQYKSGARTNAIMAPMAATVNDEEIHNIAAYLASLK